jgi:hypothetical protein
MRKLPDGSGFFGNQVVRGESKRRERQLGRRSDVAWPGLAPGALRQEARRVEELTGVTASEGPGSHAPPPSRENRWKLSPPSTESKFKRNKPCDYDSSAAILAHPARTHRPTFSRSNTSRKGPSSPSLVPAVQTSHGRIRSIFGRARLLPSLFPSPAGSGGASPSRPQTSLVPPREVRIPNLATTGWRGSVGSHLLKIVANPVLAECALPGVHALEVAPVDCNSASPWAPKNCGRK